MLIAILLQSASAQPLPNDVWASVSSTVARKGASTSVEFVRDEGVEFIRDEGDRKGGNCTVRLTSRQGDSPPIVRRATSRGCSGVRQAVDRLRVIPMPVPEFPSDNATVVMDGTDYTGRLSARYGSEFGRPLVLRSNLLTSLADWVEGTLTVLQPCWAT